MKKNQGLELAFAVASRWRHTHTHTGLDFSAALPAGMDLCLWLYLLTHGIKLESASLAHEYLFLGCIYALW